VPEVLALKCLLNFLVLTADGQLNSGRNEAAIRNIFVARGILPNPKRGNRRAGITFDAIHERRNGSRVRRRPPGKSA
jgi:hypothetical protein